MCHYEKGGKLHLFGLTDYGIAIESVDNGESWSIKKDFVSEINVAGDTLLAGPRGTPTDLLCMYEGGVDSISKPYDYTQFATRIGSEYVVGAKIAGTGQFPLSGSVKLFTDVNDTALVAIKDTGDNDIYFENVVDVIASSNDTRYAFGQLMSTRDDIGQLVSKRGAVIQYKEGEQAIRPLVRPFDTERWIYDVLSLGNDSVLVAAASKVTIVGHGDPVPSSGTLWKGSLNTLEFRQISDIHINDGSLPSRGWCFTRASNGWIYASGSAGGIIRSRDNGETWSAFEHEFTSQLSINGIHAAQDYLFVYTTKGLFRIDWTSTGITRELEKSTRKLEIRPQPASERVTVDVLNWESDACATLSVYSVTGELQMSVPVCSATIDVNTTTLNTGVYTILVDDSKQLRCTTLHVIR